MMRELPLEVSGLYWQDDFITAEHEAELIAVFRGLDWPDRGGGGGGGQGRLSLHYGYTFDYKTFGVDPDVPFRPFPGWLAALLPPGEARPPDQVCLQHYPPGAGIPPHVDTHSAYDQLYALSLGSPVVMQFARKRPVSGGGGGGGGGVGEDEDDDDDGERGADLRPQAKAKEIIKQVVEVDLTPRSMMRMAGDARLHWTHGIRKRKTDPLTGTGRGGGGGGEGEGEGNEDDDDNNNEVAGSGSASRVRRRGDRWSITYRWIRDPPVCECGDAALCDTAQARLGIEKEKRWKTSLAGPAAGEGGGQQEGPK